MCRLKSRPDLSGKKPAMNSPFSDSSSRHPLLESYQFLLYSVGVGDGQFDIENEKSIVKRGYSLRARVGRGVHAIEFKVGEVCVTDVVTPSVRGWPDDARLVSYPCVDDRENAYFVGGRVEYTGAVGAEILQGHQYCYFLDEMVGYARQVKALFVKWDHFEEGESGEDVRGLGASSLSVVNMQPRAGEVHVQAWHLDGSCGLVVRTQAIFELVATSVVRRRSSRGRVEE